MSPLATSHSEGSVEPAAAATAPDTRFAPSAFPAPTTEEEALEYANSEANTLHFFSEIEKNELELMGNRHCHEWQEAQFHRDYENFNATGTPPGIDPRDTPLCAGNANSNTVIHLIKYESAPEHRYMADCYCQECWINVLTAPGSYATRNLRAIWCKRRDPRLVRAAWNRLAIDDLTHVEDD